MKTNSISSTLSDFIGEAAGRSNSTRAEGQSYQKVSEELAAAAQPAPAPAGTGTPAEATMPPASVSAPPEAAAPPFRSSADPIWDTGWEIEPNEPELGQAALASLRGLFSKNGLKDDAVKLSYIEEIAVCPGVRSWVNRSVVVEYPNGQLEKFSAEWTQKRPEWTLCSMLERMGAEGPVQVVT